MAVAPHHPGPERDLGRPELAVGDGLLLQVRREVGRQPRHPVEPLVRVPVHRTRVAVQDVPGPYGPGGSAVVVPEIPGDRLLEDPHLVDWRARCCLRFRGGRRLLDDLDDLLHHLLDGDFLDYLLDNLLLDLPDNFLLDGDLFDDGDSLRLLGARDKCDKRQGCYSQNRKPRG